jgi:murein DD-endopeptidase MepM/ murein hydrolase activator NlpD
MISETQRKSPPSEGGESAPAKRERDSAKHQEMAQTGWFVQAADYRNHPACSLNARRHPSFKRRGLWALFVCCALSGQAAPSDVVFSADQGSIVQLSFGNEPGVKSVQVNWEGKHVSAYRDGNAWTTLLGVDLDTKPGDHKTDVLVTMEDGRTDKREAVVKVVAKKYPTTELNVDEKYVELSKADLARANRESKETEAIYAVVSSEALWSEPFRIPIAGRTGTNFGHRRIFNGEPRAPHAGADLKATTGTPIHATNRGRVALAKNLFFTGNTVILDHGLGIYSLYAHLSRIDVKKGDVVKNDQVVGLAGATGRVTGPHLHWGLRVQGARVDPFTLVGLH